MSYKSIHTGQQIDAGVSAALNPDTVPTAGSDALITSGGTKSALNTVDESIAIRVSGNKTTYASGAAIGQYVIVDGSTITGITDGLYKAAKAIPYNTVIDSTYLTAVSGGGMNDLMAVMNSTIRNHVVGSTRYVEGEYYVTNVSSQLARIQDFLTQLDTGGLLTLFDVCIYGSGIFRFTGYIYDNKAYGAGIFFGFNDSVSWKRNESVDSVNVI